MKKPSNRAARNRILKLSDEMRCHAYNAGYEYAKKSGVDDSEWDKFGRAEAALNRYLRRVLPDPPKPKKRRAKR